MVYYYSHCKIGFNPALFTIAILIISYIIYVFYLGWHIHLDLNATIK